MARVWATPAPAVAFLIVFVTFIDVFGGEIFGLTIETVTQDLLLT